jgi:hypothetical protein
MKKKQTAIEWLEKAYWDNKGTLSQKHFDQAKQMEKEQMIDAWVNGCDNGYDKACDNITWEEIDSAKDNYYNETYGGQDE